MRADRLHLLADHLEQNVKEEHFDMKEWFCGTVGCALGHACLIPEFNTLGLHLFNEIETLNRPAYGRYHGYNAASIFFDIYRDQAQYLFMPERYPNHRTSKITLQQVIKRIREFAGPKNWEVGPDIVVVAK